LGLGGCRSARRRRVGGAQHRGHELEADLVEQSGEELARHVCAAGDEDVLGARCILWLLLSIGRCGFRPVELPISSATADCQPLTSDSP
jgi:hypothetical protein